MTFDCRQLIATRPDVIFGEPLPPEQRVWLKPGNQVVSALEGLGALAVTFA